MPGTTYGHFALRHSNVLLAVAHDAEIENVAFTMDVYGPGGLLKSIEARSSLEAQDRTAYPPIRGSFAVTAHLHVTRIRLSFGETVLFDKTQDVQLKPGYQFTVDWFLGTDAMIENDYRD